MAINFLSESVRSAGCDSFADALLTLEGPEGDEALANLAFVGPAAGSCWGTEKKMDALFFELSDADVVAFVDAMMLPYRPGGVQGNQMLRNLVIRSQPVSDGAVVALCALLDDESSVLESLDLQGCEISGDGCKGLCKSLNANTTVTSLNVSWNPLGRKGGLALASMLERNVTIQRLTLANTSLDTQAVVALYSVLREQTTLREVDLCKAVLFSRQEDSTKHAVAMLGQNASIEYLDIGTSQLADLGASLLAKTLRTNTTLRCLHLRSNQIGIVGGEALASMLMQGSALVELNLSGNRLSDDGAHAMGTALANNTTLRLLDLSMNSINDEGLASIAAGMGENSTLTTLKLWGNHFSSGSDAVNAFDGLLRTRFDALGVEVDFTTYTVDGTTMIARV